MSYVIDRELTDEVDKYVRYLGACTETLRGAIFQGDIDRAELELTLIESEVASIRASLAFARLTSPRVTYTATIN